MRGGDENPQNRFYMGRDKEMAKMASMALTEDDKEQMNGRGAILSIKGRQQRGNKLWCDRSPRPSCVDVRRFFDRCCLTGCDKHK